MSVQQVSPFSPLLFALPTNAVLHVISRMNTPERPLHDACIYLFVFLLIFYPSEMILIMTNGTSYVCDHAALININSFLDLHRPD